MSRHSPGNPRKKPEKRYVDSDNELLRAYLRIKKPQYSPAKTAFGKRRAETCPIFAGEYDVGLKAHHPFLFFNGE
jgi:hypothetical protein